MFKKGKGIEGMIDYFDYMNQTFSLVGPGIPSIEVLVDLGRKLSGLEMVHMTDDNRVPGCVSNVYIHATCNDVSGMLYAGSSDSLVVGGYVHILCTAFNGLKPSEIVNHTEGPLEKFLSETDLSANLTPSRANALSNIYRLMVKKAEKYL